MNAALIELVCSRAGNACEYCLMPQIFYPVTFPIDHVIAIQHDPNLLNQTQNRVMANNQNQ
jgi:hypothetical protein